MAAILKDNERREDLQVRLRLSTRFGLKEIRRTLRAVVDKPKTLEAQIRLTHRLHEVLQARRRQHKFRETTRRFQNERRCFYEIVEPAVKLLVRRALLGIRTDPTFALTVKRRIANDDVCSMRKLRFQRTNIRLQNSHVIIERVSFEIASQKLQKRGMALDGNNLGIRRLGFELKGEQQAHNAMTRSEFDNDVGATQIEPRRENVGIKTRPKSVLGLLYREPAMCEVVDGRCPFQIRTPLSPQPASALRSRSL